MDPPPSNYLQGDSSTETKDAYRRLCVDIFRETTPISNSSSESNVPSLEPKRTESTSSRKSSSSSIASSIKPFRKMRRNISQWMSNNSNFNSNRKKSTVTAATTTTPNVVVPVSNAQLSPVRHGNVRSPKQFGAEPDSIGDAGLDIRHKLNVATAREAWEGYKAEQCSLPRITLVSPPPERSVSLPSRWKGTIKKKSQPTNPHIHLANIV